MILCLSCLSQSQAQQRSSPHRSADPAGQCQYTFTVPSPVESSCSAGGVKPELDGAISRLTLLEALVSRLMAGVDGSAGAGAEATGEEVLQEAYTQVTLERDQLEQEKESLNQQVLELQRRLEEQVREAESLRQKPCPQTHTPGGGQHRERPARGTCITEAAGGWARAQISFSACSCGTRWCLRSVKKGLCRRAGPVAGSPPGLSQPLGIYNSESSFTALLLMHVRLYARGPFQRQKKGKVTWQE